MRQKVQAQVVQKSHLVQELRKTIATKIADHRTRFSHESAFRFGGRGQVSNLGSVGDTRSRFLSDCLIRGHDASFNVNTSRAAHEKAAMIQVFTTPRDDEGRVSGEHGQLGIIRLSTGGRPSFVAAPPVHVATPPKTGSFYTPNIGGAAVRRSLYNAPGGWVQCGAPGDNSLRHGRANTFM